MSFADSLQFPRALSVIPPSVNQSPYTRNFAFSGRYNGNLAGALIMYPKQGSGAAVYVLRHQLRWNGANGITNYEGVSGAAWGTFDWDSGPFLTQAYIPVILPAEFVCNLGNGNIGSVTCEWTHSAWNPDGRDVTVETQPQYGQVSRIPFTMSSRVVSMYGSVSRNTISTTNVAISGTCNACRLQELELRGDTNMNAQFVKSYATPDKDYVASVPMQNGVIAYSGVDYGTSFTPCNPWQSASSGAIDTSYQTINTSTVVNVVLHDWSYTNASTVPEALGPLLDWTGTIDWSGTRTTSYFVSPYLTNPITDDGSSRYAVRCPAPNLFDAPSINWQLQINATEEKGLVFIGIKTVHIFAYIGNINVTNLFESEYHIYRTVEQLEWKRTNVQVAGPQQFISIDFPKPPANDINEASTRPLRGVWIGCFSWIVGITANREKFVNATTVRIERIQLGYSHQNDNPVHVCSWEPATGANNGPVEIDGNVISEVHYNNEARAYASVSNMQRSQRMDDAIDAQNDFIFNQTRKTSMDKKTYEGMEVEFNKAMQR